MIQSLNEFDYLSTISYLGLQEKYFTIIKKVFDNSSIKLPICVGTCPYLDSGGNQVLFDLYVGKDENDTYMVFNDLDFRERGYGFLLDAINASLLIMETAKIHPIPIERNK